MAQPSPLGCTISLARSDWFFDHQCCQLSAFQTPFTTWLKSTSAKSSDFLWCYLRLLGTFSYSSQWARVLPWAPPRPKALAGGPVLTQHFITAAVRAGDDNPSATPDWKWIAHVGSPAGFSLPKCKCNLFKINPLSSLSSCAHSAQAGRKGRRDRVWGPVKVGETVGRDGRKTPLSWAGPGQAKPSLRILYRSFSLPL